MTISIIVPVVGVDAGAAPCLAALDRLDPQPFEIIVSTDRPGAFANHRTVAVPPNAGPAVARNAGARAAQGEVLYFIDADCEPAPDAVARVLDAFQREPGLAAVIGSYDDEPASQDLPSQYRNLLHHYVHQNANEESCTFWGACGAIRRDVFLALDGFDESYGRPSVEDIEFGSRLVRAGHRVRLRKDLQVRHHKKWTRRGMVATDFFDRGIPWTRLILRSGHFPSDLNLGARHRWSVALVCLALPCLALAPVTALLPIAGVVALNSPFYAFLSRKRGPVFALRAASWHFVHYLTCGAAFTAGMLAHVVAALLRSADGFSRRACASQKRSYNEVDPAS
jgi:GT2 family glycosyltransferase